MKRAPLPSGASKVEVVRRMFDDIAPRYDLVNRVMTFGLDTVWRNRSLRHLGLPPRSRVLDIACGTGDYCRLLKAAGHEAIGIDLSFGMLAAARTESPLIQTDALRMPFAARSFDGVTCGFALRNFVELPALFAELARVVHPGGRIVLLDAYQPSNPLIALGHRFYFQGVVPRIGGLLSNADAYRYLPRSLTYLPPVLTIIEQIQDAGFHNVNRVTWLGGTVHMFTATRSGAPTP